MGTAVLHPQDCLNLSRRFIPETQISSSLKQHNRNPRSARRRKRSSSSDGDGESNAVIKSPDKSNFVSGQVRILKRGEKVEINEKSKFDEVKKAVKQVEERSKDGGIKTPKPHISPSGPEPNTIPKGIAERFAGFGFVDSPHPSSVPVPRFLKK